jgi:ribonuclease E
VPVPAPPPIDLSGSLQQAGLVMIETNGDAAPAAPVTAPVQALGRKPRAAAVIVDEPLQIIETKNN